MKAPAGVGERFAPMLARDLRAGTRETIDAGPRGLHMTKSGCEAFALSE
jgi:hypothetical protein